MAGDVFAAGAKVPGKTVALGFTKEEIELLDEVGETIIPATGTPGAKSVGIGAFMAMMVDECYDDAQHTAFRTGLLTLDGKARERLGRSFLRASAVERTAFLNELDEEDRRTPRAPGRPVFYFRMLRQLTLLGYFTSEVGATQALRWLEVPGGYDGDAPYRAGERAWFNPPTRSV